MFEQITEQFQSALKPANSLLAVNIQTFEKLTQHNTALVTGMVNDTMTFTKSLTDKKDLNGFLEAQKGFMEDMQEKLTSATKETYSIVSEAQEQAAEMVKEAWSSATPAAKPAGKTAKAA
ncbi:phasin family protein [Simiduia sp. 21SJ11W-1]|uniref:phasin family protein n=1 Tax=Simiduia sp. 21SJ11W-1 TaxID=2909669 RepID=UPI00209CBE3F|nr:phasin family protein [Simiduia sp. 21SJ11W-1]UTA47609.1 phasin family protein [Simiduia sp. 21SJ11W-1]